MVKIKLITIMQVLLIAFWIIVHATGFFEIDLISIIFPCIWCLIEILGNDNSYYTTQLGGFTNNG